MRLLLNDCITSRFMKKLLVLAGLLAGCRSEQVAFRFQPVSLAPAVAVAPAPVGAAAGPALASLAQPAPPAVVAAATRPRRLRNRRPLEPRATALLNSELTVAAAPPLIAAQRLLPRPWPRQRAAGGAAENGLGRTVLFFVAVFLGVLAGLAVAVNAIFSVGFFTALGLVVGGLVVLGLVYKLLSGGKK